MPKRELDSLDRRIIRALQENGRLTNVELAERIGLSPSPCLRRVKRLEADGVIVRYVALIDQRRVGLPVSVFISIKLESQKVEALAAFEASIAQWPEVMECYLMTGQRDFLLRVVISDLEAYERFLKEKLTWLDGIASIESSFALAQVKYTHDLPIES